MAGTVNKVILIGRLGKDPDVRYSADGSAIVNFTMATNEPARAADGNWEEKPEWHRIVAFGKLAERCGSYLNKGKLIYVEGKLRTRQWEDKEGVKRSTTEVVARDVTFLSVGDRPPQAESYQADIKSGSRGYTESRPITEELPPPSGGPEEDIPF